MLWGSLTSLHLYPRWFISHRKDSRHHLWSVHICLLVQQLYRVSLGVFNNWADDDSVVAGLHSHHGSSGGRQRCSAGLVLSVQTGAAWLRCPTHARKHTVLQWRALFMTMFVCFQVILETIFCVTSVPVWSVVWLPRQPRCPSTS